MNNMTFWDTIKKHNTELLASQIRKNGGQCEDTMQSVVENITYLTEKGDSFGEEKRYLRLDIRRALGSLCDTGRIVFKPSFTRWEDNKEVVTIGGYLYEVRPDGTETIVSGFACGGASLDEVYSQEMMSDNKRTASLFSLASARAESNAFYNAGIGIEFKGDVFDLEETEASIPAPEPVMPTPVSQEEKKAKAAAKRAEKKKEETVPAPVNGPEAQEETSKVNTEPVEEEKVAETAAEPTVKGSITYEEAQKFKMDCGTYEGTELGDIISRPQTARNICWAIKQNVENRTDEMKEALMCIVENYKNGMLKNFLN